MALLLLFIHRAARAVPFIGVMLPAAASWPTMRGALAVQKRLRAEYPDEPHAGCDLWAVWQMRAGPKVWSVMVRRIG